MTAKLNLRIEEIALKLCDFEEKIKETEAHLKKLKEQRDRLKFEELVDLMETNGIKIGSEIILENGRRIIAKEYFTASIPSETKISGEKDPYKQVELIEKRKKCLEWLEQNGLSDIIKNEVVANFKKEDTKKVSELVAILSDKNINYKNEKKVHPSTLKATLKEHLRNGQYIPFEDFNIKQGMVVDIK